MIGARRCYLHEIDIVSNARQGLAWQGVEGGYLWPVLRLQPQHDLQQPECL